MAAMTVRVPFMRSAARRPIPTRRGVVGVRAAAAVVPAAASAMGCAAQVALVSLAANVVLLSTVSKKGVNPGGFIDLLTAKAGAKSTAVDLNKAISTPSVESTN